MLGVESSERKAVAMLSDIPLPIVGFREKFGECL